MKTYCGERTIDGLQVTVDGERLDPRFDLHVYEETGFEWSYEGDAPRQLALAILADHLRNVDPGRDQIEHFMKTVIANLDNDWTLSETEINQALQDIT